MPAIEQLSQTSQPQLMKVLALWELIFLGMILIQPTAPVPLFGVAQKLSNGHTVTTILVAMLSPPFAILRYLFHLDQWASIFFIQAFYDPKMFSTRHIWGTTCFAALTYVGFDGITTHSKDVKNSR
jgi:hypothetical protein